MIDIEVSHPTTNRLAAYAQGRLDEPEMDAIEQHLSSCDSCCQLIRNQPEDSLVVKIRGRGAATVTSPATEGESWAEPPPGFEVPSFIVGSAANPALHDQPTVGGPPPPPALAGIPQELNDHPRYRLVAALGVGGMGAVYRAEHRLMGRPVALKVIRGDLLGNQALVERFRREVKSAARLAAHPNIVAAYDAEQAGESHMLVMEFVEGTDLARLVDRRGPLPVGEACEYVRQAALGLQHAFEDGMIHRDIKPQNLMRTIRGQVKILDFGLARFASEAGSRAGATTEGMILGSADYIAPEQIDDPHAADTRADIYSLGCTLYFLLAGHPPFPDRSLIQKLMAHREKTPRPLPEIRADVPPELAQVVETMMAKDPSRRFQTPDETARALAPLADIQTALAAATSLDAPATADTRNASPAAASAVGDRGASVPATRLGPRRRRPWVPIAAALAMLPIIAAFLAPVINRIQVITVGRESPPRAPHPDPSAAAREVPGAAHAISPRTRAILDTLEEPVPMDFADETPLDDVLTHVKQATFKGPKPTDPGLPIYVDPLGLQAAGRTRKSTVRINVNGAPLRLTLSRLLGQLGLAYLVKDDVLIISSAAGIDRERNETTRPAADASPGTKAVLATLEEPISMSFAPETPLDDVLSYIKQVTFKGPKPTDPGLPIYVDPRGLQETGQSLNSTVSIDLEGVPLRTTLRLMLEQLGLAYAVKDGTVIISSAEDIRRCEGEIAAERQ